jgi:hypothetical protein
MMNKSRILTITFLWMIITSVSSCRKDDRLQEPVQDVLSPTAGIENIDSFMTAQSRLMKDFTWYLQDPVTRRSSAASPHSKYFRVRFNTTAAQALTDKGKLPPGGTFPTGAFIVKELYDSTGAPLKYIAMMLKDPASNYAVNGWLWAELKPDGGEYISVKEKGVQCVSCHSTQSRDHTRIFDLF